MKARPMIFSQQMVLALLDGRKTQTRRVLHYDKCGAPIMRAVEGDRFWVREACATWEGHHRDVVYRADLSGPDWSDLAHDARNGAAWHIRTARDMPRWASRLTLTVTDVRVQRVQAITEADAEAEGVQPLLVPPDGGGIPHVEGFRALWDKLHGPGAWERDDWVCALTFTVTQNIAG